MGMGERAGAQLELRRRVVGLPEREARVSPRARMRAREGARERAVDSQTCLRTTRVGVHLSGMIVEREVRVV